MYKEIALKFQMDVFENSLAKILLIKYRSKGDSMNIFSYIILVLGIRNDAPFISGTANTYSNIYDRIILYPIGVYSTA